MFEKLYKIYCRTQEIIVGVFFATVVFLTFTNAVLRTMNRPIVTTDDICLLLFSWSALLGADVALRYSRLVGMDFMVRYLHPKWQKFFQILVCIIMIWAMVLLIKYGFPLALRNWPRFLNTLPISYGWVTLSLPVACCMMIFTTSIRLTKVVLHFKDDSYSLKKDTSDIAAGESP